MCLETKWNNTLHALSGLSCQAPPMFTSCGLGRLARSVATACRTVPRERVSSLGRGRKPTIKPWAWPSLWETEGEGGRERHFAGPAHWQRLDELIIKQSPRMPDDPRLSPTCCFDKWLANDPRATFAILKDGNHCEVLVSAEGKREATPQGDLRWVFFQSSFLEYNANSWIRRAHLLIGRNCPWVSCAPMALK